MPDVFESCGYVLHESLFFYAEKLSPFACAPTVVVLEGDPSACAGRCELPEVSLVLDTWEPEMLSEDLKGPSVEVKFVVGMNSPAENGPGSKNEEIVPMDRGVANLVPEISVT